MISPEKILSDFELKLGAEVNPREQVLRIIDFCIIYGDSVGEGVVPLIERGIGLARDIGFREAEIIGKYNREFFQSRTMGLAAFRESELMVLSTASLKTELNSEPELHNLGISLQAYHYWFSGEYGKGFSTIFEGIREFGEIKSPATGWNYFALGVFYFDTKDFENSRIYYQKAKNVFTDINYDYGKARAANGLASVAIQEKDMDLATDLLSEATEIYRDLAHYSGLSRALNDLGLIEKERRNFDEAVALFTESLRLREAINHVQGIITTLTELGETYLLIEGYETALGFFVNALKKAKDAMARQKEMRIHHLMYKAYKESGNSSDALVSVELYYKIRHEILSDETANKIKKLQNKFENEKAEKETEIERLKNVELKRAFAIIEEKNRDIHDSINYALRIQKAILADESEILDCFPNNFLFYKPKDIVAGDFYFFERTTSHAFYAAADCTGHGVPGALMSVVCSNALSRCVKEFGLTEPGEILDKARELVLQTFRKSGSGVRDGMDISLLVKNMSDNSYKWSGANNPLWILSGNSVVEIVADKQPIGYTECMYKFTTIDLDLSTGNTLFLFTDGYADQFGGPDGKKFKYRRLKSLIEAYHNQSPAGLKTILVSELETWQGELEQVDDVCVIGVRV